MKKLIISLVVAATVAVPVTISTSAPASANRGCSRFTYAVGSEDECVIVLQRTLHDGGFHRGKVDGKFGPITKASVKRFQKAKGLSVDGIAGPKTNQAVCDWLFDLFLENNQHPFAVYNYEEFCR